MNIYNIYTFMRASCFAASNALKNVEWLRDFAALLSIWRDIMYICRYFAFAPLAV